MVRDGWLSPVMPQKKPAQRDDKCNWPGALGWALKLKPPFLDVFCQAIKKPPVGGVPSQSVPQTPVPGESITIQFEDFYHHLSR